MLIKELLGSVQKGMESILYQLTRETYMVSAFLVDIINHLKYQQTHQTALLVSLVEHELGLALRDYG